MTVPSEPSAAAQYRPYRGGMRGGGIQEWIASQRLVVPTNLTTRQAVLYVLIHARDLTPRQADLVFNQLQPYPIPDTGSECEAQVAEVIGKVRST